jgi:DNA-binding response OmpR family regulator
MVTARSEEVDRVLGLEMGADDYVVKPFQFRELLARLRANLRRVELDQIQEQTTILSHANLSVAVSSRHVELAGTAVSLQPKEFDLLVYLMRHAGEVLNREKLLRGVWGHEYVGRRTVDVHVRRLRAKLSGYGIDDCIRTIHGVGYVFGEAAASQPSRAT